MTESEQFACATSGLSQGKPDFFLRRLSHFAPFDCIGKCSPAVRRSRSPLSLWRFLLFLPHLPAVDSENQPPQDRARNAGHPLFHLQILTLCLIFSVSCAVGSCGILCRPHRPRPLRPPACRRRISRPFRPMRRRRGRRLRSFTSTCSVCSRSSSSFATTCRPRCPKFASADRSSPPVFSLLGRSVLRPSIVCRRPTRRQLLSGGGRVVRALCGKIAQKEQEEGNSAAMVGVFVLPE